MMVWEHIVLPFLAILALGVMDRHARRGLAAWLVNLGWDSCVLALGAAPAVFLSDEAAQMTGGKELAVCWGFAFILFSIFVAGGVVGSFRGIEAKHDGHALVSLAIGGVLLGSLLYVATWKPSHVSRSPNAATKRIER
jgi:hypothetical protein